MVEKEKNGKKFALKMGSMIISGVLGLVTLIGIFWGKTGVVVLGMTIFVALVIAIVSIGNTY